MDFSILMVTILISAVCGKQRQPVKVKVKACETEVPKNLKCSTLQVDHGTACYEGDKSATVSCSEQYSFNTEIGFKCKEKKVKGQKKTSTWSPTDTAKCSYTETTACLTSMSSTCTTSIPNTPDFTTIDTSSSVTLYSTTHVIQTDKTESVFTTYFESILLPSENSMFSTSVVSATLSMTTPILQSDTVTGIPTISVTETVTSNSVSASTPPVPAVSEEVKGSDFTAVYITVPVVVCIIAVIVVIIFLFCRQRIRKSVQTVLKREKGPSSSITNKTYENTIERHCSLINVRKSRDSGYAEIPLDFLHPDETSGSVYQTIDSLPEDQIKSSQTYGDLKQQTTKFIDLNYSHTNVNKSAEQSVTDTLYDHTEKADVSNQSKDNNGDGGATYNRLNITPSSMTVIEDQDKADDDTEPEYDHAKAGGTDQENKADNYSHMNVSSQTPQTFAQHEKHQYHIKDNRTKLSDIQPYEFAKEPESPGYAFAKDVENHNNENTNMNVTDTSLKQEYRELKQECIGNQDYETAVGNSNIYFILEPEEGSGSNDVVGDFSYEKHDTTDNAESVNHQYFTLEKTDT